MVVGAPADKVWCGSKWQPVPHQLPVFYGGKPAALPENGEQPHDLHVTELRKGCQRTLLLRLAR